MDLSSKLNYYKQQAKNPEQSHQKITPSLKALQEHFSGEILFDHSPVLKISAKKAFPAFNHKDVTIRLISKNEFQKPVTRDKCVFFDLETTGLAGGAGTFAFLIGFAFWEADSIVTEQYFLPDFGREYELFSQLLEWLSQFDYIVSYNGKSYDMPLLSNRFILNRVKPQFKEYHHIDLIHMCRRIWKDSMPSCTLKSIENHILKVVRSNDIPGALIPQAYFNFINTGVIHDVIRMIEHNLQDIISLPLIFDQLHYVENKPEKMNFDEKAISSLAKIAFEINDEKYFKRMEDSENAELIDSHFKFWKSLFLKKNDMWDQAFEIWQEIVHKSEYCFFALEESAKYFEHKQKDIQAAIKMVDSAFKRLDLQKELGYQVFEPHWQERFEKRRDRLLKKI
jgi:uncharacterized protein